eukprot:6233693-Pyramimonas_sp.AAC.1
MASMPLPLMLLSPCRCHCFCRCLPCPCRYHCQRGPEGPPQGGGALMGLRGDRDRDRRPMAPLELNRLKLGEPRRL